MSTTFTNITPSACTPLPSHLAYTKLSSGNVFHREVSIFSRSQYRCQCANVLNRLENFVRSSGCDCGNQPGLVFLSSLSRILTVTFVRFIKWWWWWWWLFPGRQGFGRMFDNLFLACTFFFKVEISLHTLIPLFKPGSVHSGSAS